VADAEPGAAIPAATVVLVRTDADRGMEVLTLHKSRGHAFGDMWVFPGGRVDEGDGEVDSDPDDRARHAAVREAREETGLVLEPADLALFAHWTPPPEAPRRFVTWFFIADASSAVTDVVVDGGEIVDHAWVTPTEALERHERREIQLATPTWVTLHELSSVPTAEEALARARDGEVDRRATRLADVDGDLIAIWSGDAGYDSGDLSLPGPRHRLAMPATGPWRFERTAS
jgi:8-oxo-dGTP pyrophosphatase MutT (NUDIX family)